MELFRLVVTTKEYDKIRKDCIASNNDAKLAVANLELFASIVEWFKKNKKDCLSNKPPEVILDSEYKYPHSIIFKGDQSKYTPDKPYFIKMWVQPMFDIDGSGKPEIISAEIECGMTINFQK